MRFFRTAAVVLAMPLLNAALPAVAGAATAQDVERDYQLVDLSVCQKPAKAPPPLPAESHRTYNVQRRFVDLDRDGVCEVMDVWVERLGDDPSPGMRSLERSYFRYRDGKWQPFASDLRFYPYAIHAAKVKDLIYLEAPTEVDIGDDMALGAQDFRLLVPAGWQQTVPGSLDTLLLAPFQGQPGPILQAAAVLLAERLEKLSGAEAKKKLKGEKKKIRWLYGEAKHVLATEELVPISADGLPVLPPK